MSGAGEMSAGQRVFLVDGQAVYLEGDGEITEDVLQQALVQLAAGGAQPAEQSGTETETDVETPQADQTMGERRRYGAARFAALWCGAWVEICAETGGFGRLACA